MPASTPSIDITLDSNVTHIDLTGLDDTPPQSPAAHGNDVDEPPRKRQRLLNHASPSRSRSLTACLKAQVKPYIDAQLVKLPPDVDKVEIGRQVLCRLGSSGDFAAEFTLKKGFLSPSLERNLAKSASQFITHYASKPEFQLRAEPAASPTFDTPRFTPSTPTPTRSLPRPSPATSIATAKARVSSASTKPVSGPSFTSPVKQTDVRNNDKPPVSPANYRTKMRAKLWKSSKTQAPRIGPPTSRHAARNAWYHMPRRPYLTTEERQQVLLGSSELVQAKAAAAAKHRLPFHVDFDPDELEALRQAKWAYLPATMQWGLAEAVQHLLLVGYSPRSLSGDDRDIPDHKLNSGEICLWDCRAGERVKVMTASTQNVFEVAWHPTQPVFIVSTSPSGLMVDDHTRTQIRVFRPVTGLEGEQGFGEMQCLDCPAGDINELTIKPNSVIYSYITAACTDNTVYVWDTARGDKPIHALRHKEPIDKEEEDVGVKFSAWGTTADRFYTGGSDGLVKVWNVRNAREPLIRDLLEAPGCITCGGFSPDYSKLVVGDATGRVMLLSLDKDDEPGRGPFADHLLFSGTMSRRHLIPRVYRKRALTGPGTTSHRVISHDIGTPLLEL
ncbi:Rik1-associated factor 1 [Colletotrichum orbiculare MAFF 240422]|uniref:Rik1-associated factor 1 n=1 Tax=Colletotrichum orbiculare (strain 104-T / ATCC 96160 / CBS 514.97 / LARS 414 / MAFF 240422) TaxID=1213857 RepID=A0A484G6H9_COLOR|nr:Rik1-associated factor 1 [Colletotrichum orbiculare MAFF 240422]